MKKKLYLALMGVAVISLAVASVSARTSPSTPLYTVRMEQASSELNFLPTVVNDYNYTAEPGYNLDYYVLGNEGGAPLLETESTCEGSTCQETCPQTCRYTCIDTCPKTCATCAPECIPNP